MSRVVSLYPSDDSIIEGIRNFDDDAVTALYKRHKEYCLRNMNFMHHDVDANQDIYHEAVIVFIEKVRSGNFQLVDTSIKTYLNAICRNQILVRFKVNKRIHLSEEGGETDERQEYTDWLNEIDGVNGNRVRILKEELDQMKESGSICYELLRKFFFENKTMDQIASLLGYTNADNAKNQKWRCQDRLKKQVKRRLTNV